METKNLRTRRVRGVQSQSLLNTKPLTASCDFAAHMVAGIDRYLEREIKNSVSRRAARWNRNISSHKAYIKSVEANRKRLATIIGVVDPREPVEVQLVAPCEPSSVRVDATEVSDSASIRSADLAMVGTGDGYRVYAVRWKALKGVDAEGLLLLPDEDPIADIVALPDADWTPEMLVGLQPGVQEEAQFARRLAENGCRVLVPLLMDRRHTYSGNPSIRMTDISHREFIYRGAYELGRHIIGYEVQKVLAAVDWFAHSPLGVIGYGEGGLLALYAAALDTRIDAAAVCGYFQPREEVWREPIYRNVWALLDEFGDAEIASLVAPRPLIIEACRHPEIEARSPSAEYVESAAPGALTTPSLSEVEREVRRTRTLLKGLNPPATITLIKSGEAPPGGNPDQSGLTAFFTGLGLKHKLKPAGALPERSREVNLEVRFKRQFDQLVEHTQMLMREAEFRRGEFWRKADASNVKTWEKSSRWYRDYFWHEVIGPLPPAAAPTNPRTRLVYDESAFTGYEVVLDVFRDVIAYGVLLVPKNIKPGERRAVVVCQHGLEGRPQDVADPTVDSPHYHQFACRLAERGFVTYAPQNPYIGGDYFRVLQRKANPLKQSLFSFIVRQHERTLEWLASLPFVDAARIGFYGLSYGGKTAMRVPALVERYALSICSGDYNEWIWKNASTRHPYSYMFTGEYEMFEFNLGNTFNYAEMSWLICPRPFMVERGHGDGVGCDEWVAYEYARTRRRYDLLGLGDRTEMEVFNGVHEINAVGTFAFLERHLKADGEESDR